MKNPNLDLFVISNAAVSFMIYLAIHFSTFRLINPRAVLKWLMNIFLIGGLFNMGGTAIYCVAATDLLRQNGVVAMGIYGMVSLAIYGFAAFLYVLCIFGIHESSIRMRLLRELYAARPLALSLDELLSRYNAQTILKKRLERLLASGEINSDGTRYRIQNPSNFFLFKDFIARKILKIVGHK